MSTKFIEALVEGCKYFLGTILFCGGVAVAVYLIIQTLVYILWIITLICPLFDRFLDRQNEDTIGLFVAVLILAIVIGGMAFANKLL